MPTRHGGSFWKERQHLAADDHLAGGINSVDLENRLGDIRNRLL